jgi:TolA-binding protein
MVNFQDFKITFAHLFKIRSRPSSLLVFLLLVTCQSCVGSWFGSKQDEPIGNQGEESESKRDVEKERSEQRDKAYTSQLDAINKGLAEIKASMDQLSRSNKAFSERIRVLEQGMALGLAPDELVKRFNPDKPVVLGESNSVFADDLGIGVSRQPEKGDEKKDVEILKKMEMAKSTYNKGEFGKALVQFEKIASEAPSDFIETLYWQGRCWYELGNPQSAVNSYERYLASPQAIQRRNEAIYHLARAELKLGFSEKALGRLKAIVKESPSGNLADAARLIISSYEQSL